MKAAIYPAREGVVIRFGDVLRIRPEMYDFAEGQDHLEDLRAMVLAVESSSAAVVILRGHEDWQIEEMVENGQDETIYRTLEVATAELSMWWERDPDWP